jgi:hypothetical protein
MKRPLTWAVIVGCSGFLALFGGPAAKVHACEPILDILLFSGGGGECPVATPGCPVPTTAPGPAGGEICFGSKCRSFGGTDKGQFGQFKKDGVGQLEAVVLKITDTDTGQMKTIVRQVADDVDCVGATPQQDLGITCDALFKIRGVRPIGAGLNAPLCTFSSIDDLNKMTLTPDSQNLVLTDVNGEHCLARMKSQYWVYFQLCCKPALGFGAQGDHIETDLSMVIENNNSCSVNIVRDDQTPEIIPLAESGPCL